MPRPWKAIELDESFRIEAADGKIIAYVYFRSEWAVTTDQAYLTKEEARRVAVNIARLPELLGKR